MRQSLGVHSEGDFLVRYSAKLVCLAIFKLNQISTVPANAQLAEQLTREGQPYTDTSSNPRTGDSLFQLQVL